MEKACKEAQVPTQCVTMEGALRNLHEAISDLETRLSSVTREEISPVSEASEKALLVPLAETLGSYTAQIRGATERIRTLIDLVEL